MRRSAWRTAPRRELLPRQLLRRAVRTRRLQKERLREVTTLLWRLMRLPVLLHRAVLWRMARWVRRPSTSQKVHLMPGEMGRLVRA